MRHSSKPEPNVTARNKNGETPLSYSVRIPKLTKNRAGCISLLRHYGANVDDMARAIKRWDEDVLTLLVVMSPQPALPPGLDIRAPQIDSLLDMGMRAGIAPSTNRMMLARPLCNVDSRDRPHIRGLKLLLRASADASIRDGQGRTALQRLDVRTEKRGAANALAPLFAQLEKCSSI